MNKLVISDTDILTVMRAIEIALMESECLHGGSGSTSGHRVATK
jgi:hypothetical protein